MGLRDRLARGARPQVTHPLRVEDDTAARAELAAATASGDEERITLAREAVAACYEDVVIVALPPADMEALIGQHPPTQEQRSRNGIFNPATFVPALLAACVESDVTEDDWREYTSTAGPMTAGEVTALFNAAWDLNYRIPDPDLGKGLTTIRS